MQSAESPVAPGEILEGKYRVERIIGAGGMGVVVEAMHLDLDLPVALKFLLAEASRSGEALTRFLREGRAAAKLQSEHVARVLDVGKLASGEPYLVMEFLVGSDLSQVLQHQGPQSIDRAVSYVIQACDAIAEAHASGIIHRDLKPSNLFLTQRNDDSYVIKVLDFGISKTLPSNDHTPTADLTCTQAILGSPAYMSPEQIRSTKNVDHRTDIWSLGVVLCELLTNQAPFQADSIAGLIAAIVSEPAAPIVQLRPDLPPELGAIVMRCLQKEPSERYSSVAELSVALQPFGRASDEPIVARILRLQSAAGLIHADTVRAPGSSASATGSDFGVTHDATKKRPAAWVVPAYALGALVILGAAWTVVEYPFTTSQGVAASNSHSVADVPSKPVVPAASRTPDAEAHEDASTPPAASDGPSGSQTATPGIMPMRRDRRASPPRATHGVESGAEDAKTEQGHERPHEPVIDFSERR